MNLSKICSGINKSAQEKLSADTSRMFARSLKDLDTFTKTTIPAINKNNDEIINALEQLGRQSQALLKKTK